MCGITGFIRLPNARSMGSPENLADILHRMNSSLVHRGPDDEGAFVKDPVWMAMRRLKIIDLEGGRQPIFNEDGSVAVVYNGEIYNYIELRRELTVQGHQFKTNSDTEVLVHLYEQYGLDFPGRLRGMFAFAIWDDRKQNLIIGRDPAGIKPLHWGVFQGWLLFSSEIKAFYACPAFEAAIDAEAVDDHLTLMYIPTPTTIYKGLSKLEEGSVRIFGADGSVRLRRYWQCLPPPASDFRLQTSDFRLLLDRLEEKISESVRISLRSDVPLAVFLSSGLDSATVAYFAKRHKPDLKTYTVSFPAGSYNEGKEAGIIAECLGTDHTDIPMEYPKNLPDFAAEVLACFDEPFGDTSALPTYLLCREARRHCTVCLSGDGGDELFGGYPTFQATDWFRMYRRLPRFLRAGFFPWLASKLPTSLERVSWDYKFKRFTGQAAEFDDYRAIHFTWRGAFGWGERRAVYEGDFWNGLSQRPAFATVMGRFAEAPDSSFLDRLFYVDRTTYLMDEFLVKTDRMSMAHSLEVRPPFLDPALIAAALLVPAQYKIRGFQTKWILRRLMKGRLPEKILRLPKKGFSPPLAIWLKDQVFQDFIQDAMNAQALRSLGIIRPGLAAGLLKDHCDGRADNSRKLWVLLSLALFADRHNKRIV
ncbi:MAG: asparagine synthase (glutamine-hydrolyzing) [Elusimicrobia bacterium]|nr:asparagine synthase (glutamine-hydrolyzing) [Elusimicrobiota bacterium]